MTRLYVRVLRFAIVGTMATLVHALVALSLIHQTGLSVGPSNSVAFCAASFLSYVLNARWSFGVEVGADSLSKFLVVAGSGAVLSNFIARAADGAGLSPTMGVLLVAVVVPPISFVLHSAWTFRRAALGRGGASKH